MIEKETARYDQRNVKTLYYFVDFLLLIDILLLLNLCLKNGLRQYNDTTLWRAFDELMYIARAFDIILSSFG